MKVLVVGGGMSGLVAAYDLGRAGVLVTLVEAGPRLRPHINVFVDGEPANLATSVTSEAKVHVLPAVSGGR